MISVLILTLNEEANLPRCLEAVRWSDDVVIFDSYSSDDTVRIARSFGVRVIQRRFDSESEQRAASLRVSFKHPWVFNPDADEVATTELRDEMLAAVRQNGRPEAAYRMRRRDMFMDRWVRRSSLYPTWFIRLFRPERLSFERRTNLLYRVDGPVGDLAAHFDHYSFNKGLDAWFAKHNDYSRWEAEETIKEVRAGKVDWRTVLGAGDAVRRRRALKQLAMRLPARGLCRFLYAYLWRGGFLEGRPGLDYCILMAVYEQMIGLKVKELRRRERGLGI